MAMMTTIEKLFAQIFDRKCHVINQAKQQADSFSLHLSSKLLIHGITPPPWLWNPNASSDPNDFKKEQLLSELLQPHPRPTVANRDGFCSLYNQSFVLEGEEGVEARKLGRTHVSNEDFDLEHGPKFVSGVSGKKIGSALNASEQDVSISLQGQNAVTTSDIVTEPANEEASKVLSLEPFVLNRGCYTEDKLTPRPECSNNDVGCTLAFPPELDQSIISPQGKSEARISSNISAPDQLLYRIQRSKSRQKALELRKTVEKAIKTHQSDTNVSVVCYKEGTIFSNASNQRQPHQESGSLALAKYSGTFSDMHAEAQALGECLSKEKDANTYSGRITRSRSSCNLFTDDIRSKLENALDNIVVDGGRTIESHNNCVERIPNHVHFCNASSQRVARSNSGHSEKLLLRYSNGHEECHNQNGPSSEFILCCPDNNSNTEQKAKTDCIIGSEIILDGHVKLQAACSQSKLNDAGQSVVSEIFVSKPSSNCRMNVESTTLDFDEMEKNSLIKVDNPMVERETLSKSLEKRCESVESKASRGKVMYTNCSRKSLEKQLSGEEIPNQITKSWKEFSETGIEKLVIDDEHVALSRMSKNGQDHSVVGGKIHNSPIPRGEQNSLEISGEDVDMLMCQKKEEGNFISNQNILKCELSCNQTVRGSATTVSSFIGNSLVCQNSSSGQPEANDGSISTLNASRCHAEEDQNMMSRESGIDRALASSDSVRLHENSSLRGDEILACDGVESCFNGSIFTSHEIRALKILEESSMQGRKLRYAAENTWPQPKRRKIESQETNSIPAAISFRVMENHGIGSRSNYRNLNSSGPNVRTALQFESSPSSHEEDAAQSYASKSPDEELHSKIFAQETELLPEIPIDQDKLDFGEKSQGKRFSINVQDGECMSCTASNLSDGDAKGSEISFGLNATTADATNMVLDASTQGFEKKYKDLVHFENADPVQYKDELTDVKTNPETKPYVVEDGFHPSLSVASPQDKHLATSSSDQTMPEFEGFIIGGEDSGHRHIVGDVFDHLDLPTTSVERANVLEQLCKSAVMHTPVYQFSATRKFHRTPDVYHSVSAFNSNDGGFKKHGASYGSLDELKTTSQHMYPDRTPFSDAYYGQSKTIPPTSPVSKLWGRISSQSFSSGKKLSSHPELTCFPIEEDPSIGEEQEEDKDEVANSSQEEICSASTECGDNRNPLADITRANLNPSPSVYAAKKSQDLSSSDSVDSKINFTGTHGGVQQKLGNRHSSKRIGTNETKKKLTLSSSTNFMGIYKESLDNGFKKPNLSRKTSLRNGGKCVSGRQSKHNNIISNLSSFVPLVQQKQAAAVITGKRDVKVKALEAAEAAKRLEEKKENERKLKKEALKLERARLEQENLRQAELNRKKKEDELKKKEADVAARKRLREEEEKQVKERKRMRFEGKQQQQREQEEKLRARKLEKELHVGVVDAKLNNGTVIADALRKPQRVKVDVDKGGGNNAKKPGTESVASKSLENDVRQALLEGFEAFDHSCVSTKVAHSSLGKSYEISPYQSSDDEEDEDYEVSPRKFVPTWASKNPLALLVSSQQDVDPDILFAPESFSNVDEVSGLIVYKKT